MRLVVFRHDEKPRGVLVDPVDDPRSHHPVDPAERIEMIEESVDEGVAFVAVARVNGQPLRLVDHRDGGVLIDDADGNVFRLEIEPYGRRKHDDNLLSRP